MTNPESEQATNLKSIGDNKYSGQYIKSYLVDPILGEDAVQQGYYGNISDIGLFKSLKTSIANPLPSNS